MFRLMVCLLILAGTFQLCGCIEKEDTAAEQEIEQITPIATDSNVSISVMSEGKVVPLRSAMITFPRNGVVVEVLAEEGDEVKNGDVLVRLDGYEELKAAIASAEVALLDAKNSYKNLLDNAEKQLAASKLALAQAESALDRAKDREKSKDYKVGEQENIDGAYAEYILAVEKVKDLEEDFEDYYKDKLENDYGRAEMQAKISAAKDQRDKAWQRYDDLNSMPDEFDVAVVEAELKVAQSQYEKALKDWQDIEENGIDPDDLKLTEANIKNAEAQLLAAEKNLSDIELKAPFDGVVLSNPFKVGETIDISSTSVPPMITIADTTEWKIETTDLTELDVVSINKGSSAIITFDAIPDLELTGKVSQVRLVGESKQGDITYTVTIELDEQDDRLLWNMTAFVIFE